MCTASSASRTCGARASASLYTATLRMPSSWQARTTRRAISPRLAIRIFENMKSREWGIGNREWVSAAGPPIPDSRARFPLQWKISVLLRRIAVALRLQRVECVDESRPRVAWIDDVVHVPAGCRDVRVRELLRVLR